MMAATESLLLPTTSRSTSPSSSSSSSFMKKMKRSNSAPAMSLKKLDYPSQSYHLINFKSTWLPAILLILYISLCVITCSFNRHHFSGAITHPFVDALFFSAVTICTVGYGDIAPTTPAAKLLSCLLLLIAYGLIIHVVAKGTIRLVAAAAVVVVVSVGIGILLLCLVERIDWVDSVYVSVMSVTTVGYGDRAFETVVGRLLASVWVVVSTVAVARVVLYVVEARAEKRHREIEEWMLHQDVTVEDLLAADVNHNGIISESEYVIYKLKEMGKIKEKDVLQICHQFNKLGPHNSGKINLSHLCYHP